MRSNTFVATTELTSSFGWKELDVLIPRDAIEFQRVLGDKLTKLMKVSLFYSFPGSRTEALTREHLSKQPLTMSIQAL